MELIPEVELKTPQFAAPQVTEDKVNLVGLSRAELKQAVVEAGFPAFRANQLWHWIYHRGVTAFGRMTSIAKSEHAKLDALFTIGRPKATRDLTSFDGTRKWLLEFADGNKVEMVHIPEEDRGALCVSSQVGCTLSCAFCHTGTMKLVRNLTAAEIVEQVMTARDGLSEWPVQASQPPAGGRRNPEPASSREQEANVGSNQRLLSNIVMMGMGEPLFNYEHVAKALKIIMDGDGIAISKRRITLSTSGVVPMIERCGKELDVNLAISLHAVRDDLRNVLVPLNKKYPIKELLEACHNYPGASNARRITFEYVMLKNVNDSDEDAYELCRLLKGIHAKVNLIPFNPWPGTAYECSSNNRVHAFAEILNERGFSSPVRKPRGRDILAACGQLKSDSERKAGQKVKL
jgi:23S rRNA (adenine2503-C2)-methyltransferase